MNRLIKRDEYNKPIKNYVDSIETDSLALKYKTHSPTTLYQYSAVSDAPSISADNPHAKTRRSKFSGFFNSLKWSGPGVFVAVGYIDPGNWATDLAGGTRAGYALLSVVLISSLIAILLQVMCARLGIATEKNLAQLSREVWPRLTFPSWIAAEIAIIATDLAEVLGSAIALKLLFSIPLIIGVTLTVLDVFLLLAIGQKKTGFLGRAITFLLFIITSGFIYELVLAQPVLTEVLKGFIPSKNIISNPQLLYLAIGIVGATVMPHNLYLHSNLVIKRWAGNEKRKAAKQAMYDTIFLLSGAMFLNCALVILAASVFHHTGLLDIEITDAYHLLSPLLGTSIAPIVFAIMLLASSQSASITGTLAGQVVMNGYLNLSMRPWIRRFLTRGLALIPALLALSYFGEQCTANLLVTSQVLLSLQLPLAMIPLLLLTSNKNRMKNLVNPIWMKQLGWLSTLVIIFANFYLIYDLLTSKM
jgi:manganese transport protein